MTDPDDDGASHGAGSEEDSDSDEGDLALGAIFTVSSTVASSSYVVQICMTGSSSSTIARTDNRSIRK
jgi:hypothetical protein